MKRFSRIETLKGPAYCEVDADVLWLLDGAPWNAKTQRTGVKVPLREANFRAVSDATKVVCVGQNYRKHAEEMGKPVPVEPLIFLKPPSALNGHLQPIFIPPASQEVHHEAELGLVIGERLTRVSEADALRGVFAVTCFNDVTARDIQKREIQHTRGKGYDSFACAGPQMVTGLDFGDLRIQARVNRATKQDSRTSDMIFSPAKLVSFISQVMTLMPGDLIATGTPSGVGPIRAGDSVEIEIQGIGVLENPVLGR